MVKLSNLIYAGLGALAAKYYIENPKKAKEHKALLKEKTSGAVAYTKCMINYTQKNGLLASAEYLKNDVIKVLNNHLPKDEEGENLSFKDNALVLKEKGIELSANVKDAVKVVKEDINPELEKYAHKVKILSSSIANGAKNIKDTIEKDGLKEKISDFKEKANETIETITNNVEEITGKSFSKNETIEENTADEATETKDTETTSAVENK